MPGGSSGTSGRRLGGEPFPYVWVPECTCRWSRFPPALRGWAVSIKRSLIDEAWGHGFVHIKLLGDLPVGSGRLAEARRAAGYLGKYVGKSFEDARIPRRHRYDVAQGFQPERVPVWGRSAVDAIERPRRCSVGRCRRGRGTRPSRRLAGSAGGVGAVVMSGETGLMQVRGAGGTHLRGSGGSAAGDGSGGGRTGVGAAERGRAGGRAQARSASTPPGPARLRSARSGRHARPLRDRAPMTPGRISTWSTRVLTMARCRSRFRVRPLLAQGGTLPM